jgi:hypothetical protein
MLKSIPIKRILQTMKLGQKSFLVSIEKRQLVAFWLLAMTLRSLVPLQILISNRLDFIQLMSYSTHAEIFSYIYSLGFSSIIGPLNWSVATSYYMPYALLSTLPFKLGLLFNYQNMPIFLIQIFQGFADSLGCFLVYAIITRLTDTKKALWGAFLYALWLPSIFYNYHIFGDSYVPILSLTIIYLLFRITERPSLWYPGFLGLTLGLLNIFRPDNIMSFLTLFLSLIIFRNKIPMINRRKIIIFVSVFLVCLIPSNLCIKSYFKIDNPSQNLGVALYNALGEWPGTYKGIRFYKDTKAQEHAQHKAEEYTARNDKSYLLINMYLFNNPLLSAYVREVIIGNPVLYFDWILRRFVGYISAHNYWAHIIYFWSNLSPQHGGYKSMENYRFDPIFNAVKYFDYLLFLLFVLGMWSCRSLPITPLIVIFYLSVVLGHALTQVGEVYFREDLEYSYNHPVFLLPMVTLWPIFIPIGYTHFLSRFRQRNKSR